VRRRSLGPVRPVRRSSRLCALAAIVAQLLASSPSRAEKPEPAVAFVTGACVFLAGFAAGGLLLGTSQGDDARTSAGWVAIEAGFVLAPLVSHGVEGEWTRGMAFAAPPAAMLAGTAVIIGVDPSGIDHGQIGARLPAWSFLTVGLITGIVGVIDSTLADTRARAVSRALARALSVTPTAGPGQLGLRLEATL
jgi:hypothetical protein